MPLRIPQNKIQFKYTIGNEYIYADSYKNYQGHYYEINGRVFAGKEVKIDSPLLIKKDFNNLDLLKLNPSASVYNDITKKVLNNVSSPPSFIYRYESNIRYFIYHISKNLIKEINRDTFEAFKSNPLYKIVRLSFINEDFIEEELNIAEQIIPDIRTFVKDSNFPPGAVIEDQGIL